MKIITAEKKPIVIQAVKWEGDKDTINKFIGLVDDPDTSTHAFIGKEVLIKTLEGVMTAKDGDYIIKGVKGEFYPCKPDIFEECYKIIGEQNEPN